MNFATPILLVCFRRPDTTERVIDALRLLKPTTLYPASDAADPTLASDVAGVVATRRLLDRAIDWPCHVHRRYCETNQGCRLGPSTAIDWLFEQEEEGIILEDDCLPDPDFFPYCASLLEHFRHDTRVFSICGSNFQDGQLHGDGSYYLSLHGDSWGWATWRRAWRYYHKAEELWPRFRDSGHLADVFRDPAECAYWQDILDRVLIGREMQAWDYQWWLAIWMNHGLNAWPNQPLISNIGFTGTGTHTFGENRYANLPLRGLGGALRHPTFLVPSAEADAHAFTHRRGGAGYRIHLQRLEQRRRYGPRLFPWVDRLRRLREDPGELATAVLRRLLSPLRQRPVEVTETP